MLNVPPQFYKHTVVGSKSHLESFTGYHFLGATTCGGGPNEAEVNRCNSSE